MTFLLTAWSIDMFDQAPNEQANISGADFAIMCDEITQLRAKVQQQAEALRLAYEAIEGAYDYVEDAIQRYLSELGETFRPQRLQYIRDRKTDCDEALSAIDALGTADAKPQSQWRPIETAPKDGTRIMLANSEGCWMGEYVPVFQSGFKPDNPWRSAMLNHYHIKPYFDCTPTGWMPLPAPETKGEIQC